MKNPINKILALLIPLSAIIVLGSLSVNKSTQRSIHDVLIEIEDYEGNYFVGNDEIYDLLNQNGTDYLLGAGLGSLDLELLEKRVKTHTFITDAEVFHDLKGNIMVTVEQAQPLARIYDPKGADFYIDKNGFLLPVNAKQTARVPLIEIEKKQKWKNNITETSYGRDLMEMIRFIHHDSFWKAQVAHLIIDGNEDIFILPQVTKQKVVFGKPDDLTSKFRRLKLFYKDILPRKGWNTYSVVNLKFKNQIICK